MSRWFLFGLLLPAALAAGAQSMNMGGPANTLNENVLRHLGSGTSLEPGAAVPPMMMRMTGNHWMLMLHGYAWVVEQQQTGPRGHDKLFSANWFMGMAQRNIGQGQLTLRTMLSLEPATISGRYYAELFQQGETAFGEPIVDGQHPHNFFMEIGGVYDQRAGEHVLLSGYGAVVGDPALGPVAFPHRASAAEDPLAPLGHHLEDSTHIAFDVVTAGASMNVRFGGVKVEGSGFHGREPDENRWHIEAGAIDSWSARLSIVPDRHWVGQYSLGRLHSPEALHPDEDVLRQTASVTGHYGGKARSIDVTLVWGRNHTAGSTENANGYLAEGLLKVAGRNFVWTRIENADRTTDLLGAAAPPTESVVGRAQAYTGGYAYRLRSWGSGAVDLGAQVTGYNTPVSLVTLYGTHPVGVAAVVRWQLGR